MVTHRLLQTFIVIGISSTLSLARKDIILEDFGKIENGDPDSATPPLRNWYALTDPVMGGKSTGIATATDGLGIFTGEVNIVPSLNTPAFIAMQTRGGFWPDLSSCQGLKITSMSKNSYDGFRISFGRAHVTGNSPYATGHRAPYSPGINQYTDEFIPFTDFSNNWDAKTGDTIVSCVESSVYCPDEITLRNLQRFEIMAEGVAGKVDLTIKYITAVGCDDDVVEKDPNPGTYNNHQGGNGQGQGFESGPSEVEFVGNIIPQILPNGDVRIDSWPNSKHAWYTLNDPVMGGESTSTVTVENDICIFEGEVVDVPFLSSPGFIKMETRGGEFPDVSHCKALKFTIRSLLAYNGLHATFGVHHADNAMPFVRGYKAPFSVTSQGNSFEEVVIPFTDFSDKWDPNTGDIIVKCKENSIHCPNEATLRYFTTFSIMGEGVDGKVHLEIKSIDAVGCEYNDSSKTISRSWVGIFFAFFAAIFVGIYIGRRTAKFSGCYSGINHQMPSEMSKKSLPPLTSLRGSSNVV